MKIYKNILLSNLKEWSSQRSKNCDDTDYFMKSVSWVLWSELLKAVHYLVLVGVWGRILLAVIKLGELICEEMKFIC